MLLFLPDRRTHEEKTRDHQRYIERHFLASNRSYTFEVAKHCFDGWNWLGLKRMRWTAYIKEAECPWRIIACEIGFRTKWKAERWARAYLKRGGPPEGHFA